MKFLHDHTHYHQISILVSFVLTESVTICTCDLIGHILISPIYLSDCPPFIRLIYELPKCLLNSSL